MRVFIGVELPEAVREACAALAQACRPKVDGRWALPGNYQITLSFIGEVEPAQLEALQAILQSAAVRFSPPRLGLAAPGVFIKRGGGILYCGVRSDTPLEPLHDALCSALRGRGLVCDPGPFAPHITLARRARVTDGTLPLPRQAEFVPAHMTLFESARDAQGVLRYVPRLRCAWTD